jgi:hypothetical protein
MELDDLTEHERIALDAAFAGNESEWCPASVEGRNEEHFQTSSLR